MLQFLFSVNIVWSFVCILIYFIVGADPRTFWLFSISSILIPIFFIVNILLVLFWLIFRWRYLFVPLITLIFGYSHYSKIISFQSEKESEKCKNQSVNIMTYNIYGLKNIKISAQQTREHNKSKFISFLRKYDPDILCVQEDNFYADDIINKTELFPYFHYEPSHATAIYTKFPILDKGFLDFGTVTNSCVWADVLANGKKIRIYSVHLASNRVSSDVEKITDETKEENAEKLSLIRRIMVNYRRNSVHRAKQSEMIMAHAKTLNYPFVICGDCNDTAFSYSYEQFEKGCKDSFIECGDGIGSTYIGALPGLRIDYIFGDKKTIEFCSHKVLSSTFSDHNPVFVKLFSKI
ncbi:MAG: endonuclease/exonuclease/phosphatase family protein [Saprospiraceae bacterium]|nr:endonuclease/exonuclease/phosphatase family protein [Saprospiraceae bacterium]